MIETLSRYFFSFQSLDIRTLHTAIFVVFLPKKHASLSDAHIFPGDGEIERKQSSMRFGSILAKRERETDSHVSSEPSELGYRARRGSLEARIEHAQLWILEHLKHIRQLLSLLRARRTGCRRMRRLRLAANLCVSLAARVLRRTLVLGLALPAPHSCENKENNTRYTLAKHCVTCKVSFSRCSCLNC